MNQWECEECGAIAAGKPRKEAIESSCYDKCKWIFNPKSHEDQDDEQDK